MAYVAMIVNIFENMIPIFSLIGLKLNQWNWADYPQFVSKVLVSLVLFKEQYGFTTLNYEWVFSIKVVSAYFGKIQKE